MKHKLTDQQAEHCVTEFLKGCDHPSVMESAPASSVSATDVVHGLRANGVDWWTILVKALPLILSMIPGGQSYAEILAAVLAIIHPTPAP